MRAGGVNEGRVAGGVNEVRVAGGVHQGGESEWKQRGWGSA